MDANGTATPQYEETIVGVVSGTNIINSTRGAEGTAQAHNAGAVVEVLVTALGWNDLIDGLLVGFNQDGTVKNISASAFTINASRVTASDVVASSSITASIVNANVTFGAWVTDSPATSAVTMNMGVGGSNKHQITLSDSTTSIYVSNVQVGQAFMIRTYQGGSGTRLASWFPGSTVKWAGGSSPTLTTTASKADSFGFVSLAASTYDGFIVGQNL